MAAPTTSLVTLTITEKGYEVDADDPAPSERSTSAPALIALALARRRRAGLAPPVFASLDNLLDNGNVLRAWVLVSAGAVDPSLAEWIADEVSFPNSVVDRHGAGCDRTRPGGHRLPPRPATTRAPSAPNATAPG